MDRKNSVSSQYALELCSREECRTPQVNGGPEGYCSEDCRKKDEEENSPPDLSDEKIERLHKGVKERVIKHFKRRK